MASFAIRGLMGREWQKYICELVFDKGSFLAMGGFLTFASIIYREYIIVDGLFHSTLGLEEQGTYLRLQFIFNTSLIFSDHARP